MIRVGSSFPKVLDQMYWHFTLHTFILFFFIN
jgi:hypothetical protein